MLTIFPTSHYGIFLYVGCRRGGRMWFHIHGLSGNEGIEEILNDDNTLNMVEYSKGYDSIDVFMVEHEVPLAVSHGGVMRIDKDANNNSSMANAGHDQGEQTETRMQGQQSFCTDDDTNNYSNRANAGHDQGERVQTVQPNESSSELSNETYRPSGQSGDVEIGNDRDLSNASWLYDDFEGDEITYSIVREQIMVPIWTQMSLQLLQTCQTIHIKNIVE